MHIWYLDDWKNYIDIQKENHRTGLRLRFEKEVDSQVRAFCIRFAKWVRKEFFFPIRLNVYIKADYRIKAMDGEYVVGTFWRPVDYNEEPYVRLATGDYQELKQKRGEEQAMWAILRTFAHELTHYMQHINGLELTPIGEERQATMYMDYILWDYEDYLANGERLKWEGNLWMDYKWERNIDLNREKHRTGLELRAGKNVDCEVHKACREFAEFLRREYFFPIRVVVSLKDAVKVVDENNEKVDAYIRYKAEDYTVEPRIYVAVGDYPRVCSRQGKEKAINAILFTIARQLTFYYQWINSVSLTPRGRKQQAARYAKKILQEYTEWLK